MDFRAILLGVTFALMWSSAFSSARIIVAVAPPLTTLSIRFFIAGLIGVVIAKFLGQTFKLTKGQRKSTIIFGIFQNAFYLGLNFIAMQTVEASLASIIASSMPLMVAFAGWAIFRERLSLLAAFGLCLGFVGVGMIMGLRINGGADGVGVFLCIVGAAALAVATLSVRGASGSGNLMMVVGLQMIVGAIFLGIAGVLTEELRVEWSWLFVFAFIYTTLVPGLAATVIWFLLVNRIGTVKASTFHFLNPFFGVAVAAVILGEAMGPFDFAGVIIITIGILAVQLSKQKDPIKG